MNRTVFPFTAVLGQDQVKQALILNLINPRIGGVLITGEKGTAKSTLVRGSAALSETKVIVELPLNVTEDRLVGSIDLKQAMLYGRRQLEPGILKAADGNILYVDEINLLSDHIVNTLLAVAANKVNYIEREGISESHPSHFILVGSMNPEEGKLRPQLLDRFGLYVEVEAETDLRQRMEIVRRRLDFEDDPVGFVARYSEATKELAERVSQARRLLQKVEVTNNAMQLASSLAAQYSCAGHRGEITLIETARAIAAFDGRWMINVDDITAAAELALPHRAQAVADPPPVDEATENPSERQPEPPEQPEPEQPEPEQPIEDDLDRPPDELPTEAEPPEAEPDIIPPMPPQDQDEPDDNDEQQNDADDSQADDDLQEANEAYLIPRWVTPPVPRMLTRGNGKRNLVKSNNRQGRYVKYRLAGDERITDLAFDATIRAAAAYQPLRDRGRRAIAIERDDLRVKVREKRTGSTILFVVDASASMGANRRMKEVKAAILSMLNVSYQKRDKVGLIAFRKDDAELLLGITRSVDLAQKQLALLPTGGKTPLARGLDLAYEVIMGLKMKDKDILPTLVLVSDGRASGKSLSGGNPFNDALRSAERIGNQNINTIVLDTENDFIRFNLCRELNEKLHGTLITMEELQADGIVEVITRFR